jgi:hypothetical protein
VLFRSQSLFFSIVLNEQVLEARDCSATLASMTGSRWSRGIFLQGSICTWSMVVILSGARRQASIRARLDGGTVLPIR